MFEEYDDCFVWRCNTCGKTAEFPPGDFWGALAELKSRGWKVSRGPDDWEHYCGACRKKMAEAFEQRWGNAPMKSVK